MTFSIVSACYTNIAMNVTFARDQGQLKRLRGTPLDPFGHTKVRRAERALTTEYLDALARVLAGLTADNLSEAVRIAELPDLVRGYEELKLTRIAEYRSQLAASIRQ